MMRSEVEHFIADRDIVDSLKLEASTLHPKLECSIARTIPQVVKALVDEYSFFMPLESLERAKSLPERAVVTDTNTYGEFRSCWSGITEEDTGDTDGKVLFTGNIILVKDPASLSYMWDNMSDDGKEAWVKEHGNEQEVRRVMGEERLFGVLIHEIVHTFHPQRTNLSLGFVEDGVCYYSSELARKFDVVSFSLLDDLGADVYGRFLRDHGENVHRIFFGLESDPEKIKALNEAYSEYAIALLTRIGDELRLTPEFIQAKSKYQLAFRKTLEALQSNKADQPGNGENQAFFAEINEEALASTPGLLGLIQNIGGDTRVTSVTFKEDEIVFSINTYRGLTMREDAKFIIFMQDLVSTTDNYSGLVTFVATPQIIHDCTTLLFELGNHSFS